MNSHLVEAFCAVMTSGNCTQLQRTRLLFLIARAMEGDGVTNVRSLYYYFPDLFPTPDAARRAVKRLCDKTGLTLARLNLYTTSKGLYYYNNYQFLIEERLELQNLPSCLLLLEKDTIFYKFRDAGHVPPHLALLTGKGFPDCKTLAFVKKYFSKARVFGLCDCNASGHWIMWQYAYKCSDFEVLGLFEGSGGKQQNIKMINTLQQKLILAGYEMWAKELERMKMSSQGEIDDLIREHGFEWLAGYIFGLVG